MSNLTLIAGLPPASAQLLEAAGVRSVEELARQDARVLLQRLLLVNAGHVSDGATPTPDDVGLWVRNARTVAGGLLQKGRALTVNSHHPGDLSINLDEVPEVIVVSEAAAPTPVPALSPAPTPAPAPASASASPPPPAPAVKRTPDLLEVVEQAVPVALRPAVNAVQDPRRQNPTVQLWKDVPAAEFRGFEAYEAGEHGIAPLPRRPPTEEGAAPEVKGRRPSARSGERLPRQVRRGVPHPRPVFLLFSSMIVLVSRLLMLVVIIGTPIVLTMAFVHDDIKPLLGFLWVIGAWLVACLLYLVIALRARCRVCTNQIFFSKRCFKNARAHRVFALGLVGSLALHALMFGWFRCMYCGTAIRIKFGGDPERRRPG